MSENMPKKPETLEQMINEVWFAIKGANGNGISEVTKHNAEEIEEIKIRLESVWTRDDQKEFEERLERHGHRRTDIFLAIVGTVAAVAAVVAAFGGIGGL